MIDAVGYAAHDKHAKLKPLKFQRADPTEHEAQIEVLFCGVCHSDVHQARDEWHNTVFPCLPGHEVVGRVTRVGAAVTKAKVGDLVGVGCMVNSCRTCEPCREGVEQYCEGPNSWLATYNGPMQPGPTNMYGMDNTYGGYSNVMVVAQDFLIRIPAELAPEAAAPLLCAGATTWSPLKHWGVGPGDKVGVVGLGGLGHVALKLAKALGAEVIVFTREAEKAQDARRLGADDAVVESDEAAMAAHKMSFDFILSTVPEKHDVNPFIELLKRDATLCMVGALEPLEPIDHSQVAFHRRNIAGSLIGGIAETQEVLDFCAEHGVAPEVEVIAIQRINDAYKRMLDDDVRYRFVIDMASLNDDAGDAAA